MAIYVCSKCLFCFERSGIVESCPDCGHLNVRYASNEEAEEYRRIRAELGGREREQKERQLDVNVD